MPPHKNPLVPASCVMSEATGLWHGALHKGSCKFQALYDKILKGKPDYLHVHNMQQIWIQVSFKAVAKHYSQRAKTYFLFLACCYS